ncbi:MAG: metallo-beta-lactamase family protein [Candidatus Peregrinibacteria bacterium Gr01-1014_25]|nr:MAG: metallo-beta-lactamase family protein [Candidatus Peregrinibacteria bacterium Gr01-1014_25]
MKFISHGAAREVTGTCHELVIGGRRILLDCGLFQGHRREAAEKNARVPPHVGKIDALLLSHAHMDHVGRIPVLWKHGFRAPVFCTDATKDLAEVMLADGGYIQEKDEEYFRKHCRESMIPCKGPLYTQEDAAACMALFRGVQMHEWVTVCPGVRAQFINAGHILGSAMLVLECTENGKTVRIGFSGDIGRSNLPIIPDPAPMPPVDVLICESTYGDRRHEDIRNAPDHVRDIIVRTAKRGGKIIIPAFSLERTQEVVYDLHLLWDAKQIPEIPIIIDSPLASKVTDIFLRHPESYDRKTYEDFLARSHNPFRFHLVRYTATVEESKALNATPGPMIIMAGSGMCEAGRIRHHLRNELGNPKNTVLAVGYMGRDTLGAKVVDPIVREVKIFDEMTPKRAEVQQLDAYSGHADCDDLDRFVTGVKGLQKLILVHGDVDQMRPFAKRMERAKGVVALMPERGEEVNIV